VSASQLTASNSGSPAIRRAPEFLALIELTGDFKKQNRSRRALRFLVLPLSAMVFVSLLGTTHSHSGPPSRSKECETYVVRRIVFDGNAHTRDWSIRRRIALSEGAPFLERDVEKTIKNLNRWGHLKKITREDVTVTFATEDSDTPDWHCFADVAVHIQEKW
jgi:hypothetical protein